jgi:hypothetical protein
MGKWPIPPSRSYDLYAASRLGEQQQTEQSGDQ